MSLVQAFLATWSAARATFGDDRPLDGAFPGDVVGRLQADVENAGPGGVWDGAAADRYRELNAEHARSLGALADLDRRTTGYVDELAAVVAAGRHQLDDVRQWVIDMVDSLPPDVDADDALVPVLGQAIDRIVDIIVSSHAAITAAATGIDAVATEYRAVGAQRAGGS